MGRQSLPHVPEGLCGDAPRQKKFLLALHVLDVGFPWASNIAVHAAACSPPEPVGTHNPCIGI